MKYLRLTFLFLIFSVAGLSYSQDIPGPMSPPRLVNDFAGIFPSEQREDLEQMLLNYNDSTSTQIYVVTVNDLQGYAISDYAFKLGEKWGVGQKGKNNGAVILIKPKRGNSRGDVFIAVGYGLEEKLNDARIGRIIDTYMIPYFRTDDYYSGTKAAVYAMIDYLAGQFQAEEIGVESPDTSDIIIGILLVILFIYFMSKIGNGNSGNDSSDDNRSSGGGFFPPFGGFGGGGFGSGGGFGGGGFGGGGGGSFGGGGAGRSW
jgi:uncharacterized protein